MTDPVEISGAVRYTICGEDDQGPFKVQRRFKEFFALNSVLRTRWPGVFIPAVPDKKLLNSKDEKIVSDRRILLESFLRDCSKYDYIINSREFKIFSRGPGEVNSLLEDLSR